MVLYLQEIDHSAVEKSYNTKYLRVKFQEYNHMWNHDLRISKLHIYFPFLYYLNSQGGLIECKGTYRVNKTYIS